MPDGSRKSTQQRTTIPLITNRGSNRFNTLLSGSNVSQFPYALNIIYQDQKNPALETNAMCAVKRPGWFLNQDVTSGAICNDICFDSSFNSSLVSAFAADETSTTDSTVYVGTTSVGTTDDNVRAITSTRLGSTGYMMIAT